MNPSSFKFTIEVPAKNCGKQVWSIIASSGASSLTRDQALPITSSEEVQRSDIGEAIYCLQVCVCVRIYVLATT